MIKKIMELGSGENSIATEDVFGISGEFDIDNICGTLNFNLPYYIPLPDSTTSQYDPGQETELDTNQLKKFDTCRLFYLESDIDGEVIQGTENGENIYTVNGERMTLIFDGFIDTIKLSKTKTSINYEIGALGTLGLANYRNLEYKHTTGNALELIPTLLQIAGLQQGQFNVTPVERDLIPISKVRFIDVDAKNRLLTVEGGTDLKAVLESVRKKYAMIIHQSGDGYVNLMTPWFLVKFGGQNSTLNVNAWSFDLNEGNLYEIDYGDLTVDYNAVVVLGNPPVYGVAVDPIAVQNNGGNVNYLTFENRDLFSDEDCQKVARDKLIDMEKNYLVTLKTKFHPEFMVGQPFIIVDNDRFDGTQVLTIKKYSFVIDKADVSCTVQGFSGSATMIPDDIATSNTGVFDVDILQIRDKELDPENWKNV